MTVIYEPKGAAKEYSELACNLYKGCEHGCDYCYVPSIPPWKFKADATAFFHGSSTPRANVLSQLSRDARKLNGDPRWILFCFTCDPYQLGRDNSITTEALKICADNDLSCQVLTKGGLSASECFDILAANKWKFGTTLLFSDDASRAAVEPGAASIQSRVDAIKQAHALGIHTWVSIEPVIDPIQALEVIEMTYSFVSYFKVGKINHDAERESAVDWRKFYRDVTAALKHKPHMIKDALLKYA